MSCRARPWRHAWLVAIACSALLGSCTQAPDNHELTFWTICS
jgi:multiple sugar transport system substrate-binding protein